MAYSPIVAEFHFKSCYDAITKYKEGGEDPDKLLELCDWITSFRKNGTLTDAQISSLSEYLGVSVVVPDAPDTYEDEFNELSDEVSLQGDAILELSELYAAANEIEEGE